MQRQVRSKTIYYVFLFICVLLACLIPRGTSILRVRIGVNISLYSLAALLTWLLMSRKLVVFKSIEGWFFPVWVLFVAIGVWRAKELGVWAYYLIWSAVAVLFQQILFANRTLKTFEVTVTAICIGLFVHLAIGIYEITAHTYLFETGNIGRRLYGRVAISVFRNLNDYATFLTTIFPFAIYKFFQQKKFPKKIFYAALAVVSIFLILRSECRGSVAALALLAIMLVILYYKRARRYQVITIAGILLTLIVFLVLPSARQWLVNVVQSNNELEGTSNELRINLIKDGLYFLKRTYGFGVGAGNLHYWLSNYSIHDIKHIRYMHNWYVELLATFGIVFFVLYMIVHVRNFIGLFTSYDRNDRFWNLNNTILVSFASFSIVSISSSSNAYSEWVWMYLVFVTTYCFAYCKRKIRKENHT